MNNVRPLAAAFGFVFFLFTLSSIFDLFKRFNSKRIVKGGSLRRPSIVFCRLLSVSSAKGAENSENQLNKTKEGCVGKPMTSAGDGIASISEHSALQFFNFFLAGRDSHANKQKKKNKTLENKGSLF